MLQKYWPLKKLYLYIIKTFIPLLAMSFAISLFIVLMQFLFRYLTDIVGKGITVDVFFKLIFFASMWLIPLALILGVLIASLMTYGNLGERLELLAMKSAGISLYTIMKPIFVFVAVLAVSLFIFQNDWMIKSQVKFWTYYFSIRNKSPEVAIPEGAFYRELPGFNILVKKKDSKRKMMYGVMIYEYKDGFVNASIIRADSGRVYSSKDNKMLILKLYSGESFKNLNNTDTYTASNELIPYARETFDTKEVHISFDANMNMMDETLISSQFVGKNVIQLHQYIDSMSYEVDSIQRLNAIQAYSDSYMARFKDKERTLKGIYDRSRMNDSLALQERYTKKPHNTFSALPLGVRRSHSIYNNLDHLGLNQKEQIYSAAAALLNNRQSSGYLNRVTQEDIVNTIRKNQFEYFKKFTYPVACIIFFFIGAPLGAIIRKGGVGLPIITAIIFFIIYYMLESFGIKMIKEGGWIVWVGMWMPSMILAPIGIWLTYIASKDSSVLNIENYINAVTRLLGIATARKIAYKDIAIVNADYSKALQDMRDLDLQVDALLDLPLAGYRRFFMSDDMHAMRQRVYTSTEALVENLSNSREYLLVHRLGNYPFLRDLSRTFRPQSQLANMVLMVLFPIGLILYYVYVYRHKAYKRELQQIKTTNNQIRKLIQGIEHKQ